MDHGSLRVRTCLAIWDIPHMTKSDEELKVSSKTLQFYGRFFSGEDRELDVEDIDAEFGSEARLRSHGVGDLPEGENLGRRSKRQHVELSTRLSAHAKEVSREDFERDVLTETADMSSSDLEDETSAGEEVSDREEKSHDEEVSSDGNLEDAMSDDDVIADFDDPVKDALAFLTEDKQKSHEGKTDDEEVSLEDTEDEEDDTERVNRETETASLIAMDRKLRIKRKQRSKNLSSQQSLMEQIVRLSLQTHKDIVHPIGNMIYSSTHAKLLKGNIKLETSETSPLLIAPSSIGPSSKEEEVETLTNDLKMQLTGLMTTLQNCRNLLMRSKCRKELDWLNEKDEIDESTAVLIDLSKQRLAGTVLQKGVSTTKFLEGEEETEMTKRDGTDVKKDDLEKDFSQISNGRLIRTLQRRLYHGDDSTEIETQTLLGGFVLTQLDTVRHQYLVDPSLKPKKHQIKPRPVDPSTLPSYTKDVLSYSNSPTYIRALSFRSSIRLITQVTTDMPPLISVCVSSEAFQDSQLFERLRWRESIDDAYYMSIISGILGDIREGLKWRALSLAQKGGSHGKGTKVIDRRRTKGRKIDYEIEHEKLKGFLACEKRDFGALTLATFGSVNPSNLINGLMKSLFKYG